MGRGGGGRRRKEEEREEGEISMHVGPGLERCSEK